MTTAIIGKGAEFQVGNGADPEVFTKIAQLRDIPFPSSSISPIDVTNQDSSGNYIEKIPSLIDPGTIEIELIFDPSAQTQQNVITDFNNRTTRNFKIVLPNSTASTFTFSGYYSGFGGAVPVQDVMSMTASIEITGVVTFTESP